MERFSLGVREYLKNYPGNKILLYFALTKTSYHNSVFEERSGDRSQTTLSLLCQFLRPLLKI